MQYEIHLTYSESLVRYAVLRFWWRVVGRWPFVLALVLLAASLAVLLISGDTSWVVGVVGTVWAMALILMVALYRVHYRNGLAKLRAMGNPLAKLVATEAAWSLSSGAGSATFPWSAVQEVWQFPKCWLMLLSKASFFTLPLDCMTPDAKAFILQQVRSAGGKTG